MDKYYLLKKNNNLQTIVPLINPYVDVSKNIEEIKSKKEKLELRYLRKFPIDFHFDHSEIDCDKEMIDFDKYLVNQYNFSFLIENFDHSTDKLNGQILYGKMFPENLSDNDLLQIQSKMNRYHFQIEEHEAKGQSVIILDPWPFENFLRDSEEHYGLTEIYQSKNSAEGYLDKLLEEQFNKAGTLWIASNIKESEFTNRTVELIESQNEIYFDNGMKDYGSKFISKKEFDDIDNAKELILELLESVNRIPFKIVELK